jgi:hypothetical protein
VGVDVEIFEQERPWTESEEGMCAFNLNTGHAVMAGPYTKARHFKSFDLNMVRRPVK